MIFTATARKPKKHADDRGGGREIAAADSLRLVASRQAALIDSLQNLVAVAEQRDETAESETAAPDRSSTRSRPRRIPWRRCAPPSPAHEDRVHFRHQRPDRARHPRHGKRRRAGDPVQQQFVEIRPQPRGGQRQARFSRNTGTRRPLFPYKEVDMSEMPKSVVIGPRRLADQLPLPPIRVRCTRAANTVRDAGASIRAWICRSRQATRFTPPSAAAYASRSTTGAVTATW